jgi:hypothetical protein
MIAPRVALLSACRKGTFVLTVDNPDEKLLPYMTANVRFAADKPAAQ